ncbi:phage tail protein [Escherichia coli]|nr:phage tail protein [Escherichia coli]
MTAKYFAILTNQGAARLANAAALGTKLNLTQMAVGDANGTLPTPDTAQTKLINQKRIAPLNLLTVDPANTSQIIAEQIIPENEGGFWIREIGLYDDDGILIAVANCPETYKPQLQEGSGRTQTIRMILIVSSTSAITLKIDPAVVLATRQYVDGKIIEVKGYADDLMKKHVEAANPHKQYPLIANALKEMVDAGLAGDVLKNLGLGEAAKRNVGTGENQIPDMASFASGDGWMKLPNGKILQYGRGAVTPTLSTQTMRITFSIPFPKKADCAMLTHSGDGGAPLGAGRGFVMTAEGPTLTGFNSAYRTSSTSDTVSMNYSWWAVGE